MAFGVSGRSLLDAAQGTATVEAGARRDNNQVCGLDAWRSGDRGSEADAEARSVEALAAHV